MLKQRTLIKELNGKQPGKKFIKSLLLALLILSSFARHYGQTSPEPPHARRYGEVGSPFIRNYPSKEYGKDHSVHFQNWAATQDKRGVMYFGNGNGVLEFDGCYWRLIKTANNSAVYSLGVDSKGTVYVGASGEFGFLAEREKDRGELQYVSLSKQLTGAKNDFASVWSIGVTGGGVYFKTADKIFRYKNGKIDTFSFPSSPFGFTIGDRFLVYDNNGIHVLKENGPQLLPGTGELSFRETGSLYILPYEGEGKNIRLLFASVRKGFFIYDMQTGVLKPFPTEIEPFLRRYRLYSCTKINGDQFAFATLKGGIVIMDMQGRAVRVINKNRGLYKDNVLYIFEDAHRNLWAGLNNGISYIQLSSPISQFSEGEGLEDIVLTVARHGGRLYAGAFDGLFYLPEYRLKAPDDRNAFETVGNIESECWDLLSTGDVLYAAGSFGVVRIDGTGRKSRSYVNRLVYCMARSKKFPHHVFLGHRGGLGVLTLGAEPEYTNRGKLGTVKGIIRQIAVDDAGDLWLSTQHGGIVYLKFTGSDIFAFQGYRFGMGHGLPQLDDVRVYNFHGRMVAITQKGIYEAVMPSGEDTGPGSIRFVPEHMFGKRFNDPPAAVYRMAFMGRGEILLETENRLGRLTRDSVGSYGWEDRPFRKIDENEAVQDILMEGDGVTWVASNNGLFRFDSLKEKDYAQRWYTLIRRVILHNGTVIYSGAPFRGGGGVGVVLDYANNSLTFEYAAVFYEHTEANRYVYKLEGFEGEWSGWTSDTKAVYTNLSEGDYCFRVKARNIFDCEGEEAEFWFSVSPPWYRTGWAFLGYGLVGVVLFLLAVFLHRRKVEEAVLRERRKYEKTYLESGKAEEYLKRLVRLMKRDKPYLNPNITIKTLAREMGVPSYHLSQVINDRLGKNFFDFINEYRIGEAKRKLVDPELGETILQVAYSVGFNSNAAFSRVFKKHTGMTPRQYKVSGGGSAAQGPS